MNPSEKNTAQTYVLTLVYEGKALTSAQKKALEQACAPAGKLLRLDIQNQTEEERRALAYLTQEASSDDSTLPGEKLSAQLLDYIMNEDFWTQLETMTLKLGTDNSLATKREDLFAFAKRWKTPTSFWEHWQKDGQTEQDLKKYLQTCQNAETLTQQKQKLLDTVQRFLVPLPADDKYMRLHLAQKIVRTHLDFETLLKNPHLVEGALWTAFLEYKQLYTEQYLSEFCAYQNAVNTLAQSYNDLGQKLLALQSLDQVSELGSPIAEDLQARYDVFCYEHPPFVFEERAVKLILDTEPFFRQFVLGTPDPTPVLRELQQTIESALSKKFQKIQSASIRKLSAQKDKDALQQLLTLLDLSRVSQLVALFATEESHNILTALRKVLS